MKPGTFGRVTIAALLTCMLMAIVSCEDEDGDPGSAVSWSGFSWDADADSGPSFSSFSISAMRGHSLFYSASLENAATNATRTIKFEILHLGQVVHSDEMQSTPTEPSWTYWTSWRVSASDPAGTWGFTIYRDGSVLSQADITANP